MRINFDNERSKRSLKVVKKLEEIENKECCATCRSLAHSTCVQERMIASRSMRPYPESADELRRRYVCSGWGFDDNFSACC